MQCNLEVVRFAVLTPQEKNLMTTYDNLVREICGRIREVRKSRGLTIQAVADRCGMKRSNLSRIEAAKNNVTLKTLCSICEALEIDVHDLFIPRPIKK